MIEPIMYFGVGFLAAALIGLVIVPLVHARAVRLTVKRMEAATPLSLAEIQADKDQLRADFARSVRRLELDVERLTESSAIQRAELGSKTDAIHRLKIDIGDKAATIFALEARDRTLHDELRASAEEHAATRERLSNTERALADKENELAKLSAALDQQASLTDTQRIELVTFNTQLDALKERHADTERERQAAQMRGAELQRELKAAADELTAERDAAAQLRRRLDDLEASLAARTAEAERLGAQVRTLEAETLDLSRRLTAGEAERAHLQGEIDAARTTEIALRSAVAEADGRARSGIDILKSEKAQLQAQLDRLGDERSQPRAAGSAEPADTALLRERITDVAAQVATLAATLEGPNSPIKAILAAEKSNGAAGSDAGTVPGPLATRMRALQKAAARPRGTRSSSRKT